MALALPTHISPAQLASFLSNLGWPDSSTDALIPSITSAAGDTESTAVNTAHMPGVIIPPFALLSFRHFGVSNNHTTSTDPVSSNVKFHSSPDDQCGFAAPIATPTTTVCPPPPLVHSKLSVSATRKSSSPTTTLHSNRTHTPETKVTSISPSSSAMDSLSSSSTLVPVTRSRNCSTEQTRCHSCQKRTRPAQGFSCRCEQWFCQKHYHPEDHNCAFDFKTMRLISPVLSCVSEANDLPESGSSSTGN
ncbi:unnamed protein product [Echinostoma caproni]|uniref:AN1-type domain-containing protein n=1 Tax=Echinostoma caproni TaxID=27848 RepID=A0A183ANJ2_9TREM|nr:unnamed protein product [Echinostoma caproni]